MSEPSAKVICDSVSPDGVRLTTMEVVMHRFVLAEFNTHRAFSRNSASSRAIPVHKRLKAVMEDPAVPLKWAAEQPGMQGGDEVAEIDRMAALLEWLHARDEAVGYATALMERGIHKSIANRLLEPFMWHTVVVTATEWANFFRQRCSPLAQPEIRVVAEAMQSAYLQSSPDFVGWGEWHTPYIREVEDCALTRADRCMVSVARCARVSYLTHDGIRDVAKDIELFDKLVTADPPHASPLEHVATPARDVAPAGNFEGWHQFRHWAITDD